MKLSEYLIDRLITIMLHLFCMLMLTLYLKMIGVSNGPAALILIAWTLIITVYFGVDYARKRRYFAQLMKTMGQLDQKYLIGELMEEGHGIEHQMYRQIIRQSNKAVIERIRQLEDEKRDYREYIEGWIHEVKTPLTALQLQCHNHKAELRRREEMELNAIDNYVEQALFYSRSDSVYKDFVVQKVRLSELIQDLLMKNRQYFIQNQISIELEMENDEVRCDPKWVSFILNQILLNAVKYKKKESGRIRITTRKNPHGTVCQIYDDGIGIKASEIDRIFEKGFIGTNGRNQKKSTGIGLYLCKKLCDKLDIRLQAESVENEYTSMSLFFSDNRILTDL